MHAGRSCVARRFAFTVMTVVGVACTTPAPPVDDQRGVLAPCWRALDEYDETWLRSVEVSPAFLAYLELAPGSLALSAIPAEQRTRFAMVESFAADPNWNRIWRVAAQRPDLEAGIAVLNFLEGSADPTWSASYFENLRDAESHPGFDACVFAHIRDEPSVPSPWNPLNWIEDTFGSHYNDFANCAWFLARRSKPCMQGEWQRLSRFTRNREVRNAARGVLSAPPDDSTAAFSNLVERVRQYREQMAGKP
jgi:hypothetical protein